MKPTRLYITSKTLPVVNWILKTQNLRVFGQNSFIGERLFGKSESMRTVANYKACEDAEMALDVKDAVVFLLKNQFSPFMTALKLGHITVKKIQRDKEGAKSGYFSDMASKNFTYLGWVFDAYFLVSPHLLKDKNSPTDDDNHMMNFILLDIMLTVVAFLYINKQIMAPYINMRSQASANIKQLQDSNKDNNSGIFDEIRSDASAIPLTTSFNSIKRSTLRESRDEDDISLSSVNQELYKIVNNPGGNKSTRI